MTQTNAIIRDYTVPEIKSHLDWMREQMTANPESVEMTWVFGHVTVSVNRTSNNRLQWSIRMRGDFASVLPYAAIPAFVQANQ